MDCLPQLHVAAIHSEPGYRTATPGIGVLCRSTDDVVAGFGIFSNSIGNLSKYAMVGWQPVRVGEIKLGMTVGTIDGYYHNNGGFVPMASLVVSYRHLHLTFIPKTTKNAAALELSFTFSETGSK